MGRTASCWWYQQYAPENVVLSELQRSARRAGLGLWGDPDPVPLWEWRREIAAGERISASPKAHTGITSGLATQTRAAARAQVDPPG